jgi:hypothetical protein
MPVAGFCVRWTCSLRTPTFAALVNAMAELSVDAIAVCIQALEDAIRYYDFLSQSQTVDPDDHAETKYMYEVQLAKLCAIYAAEEKNGNTSVPLSALLKNP